jgi:hypothetical protein
MNHETGSSETRDTELVPLSVDALDEGSSVVICKACDGAVTASVV